GRRTVYGADDRGVDAMKRHGRNFQRAQVRDPAATERAADTATGSGIFEIQSGTESAAFASQNNRAHLGIAVILSQPETQRGKHLHADRIHSIGTIQPEDRDMSLLLGD